MKSEGWYLLVSLALGLILVMGFFALTGQAAAGNPVQDASIRFVAPVHEVRLDGNRADLSIHKTASPPTTVPGAPITYTLVFTNNGPQTATGVVITDIMPISVTKVVSASGGVALTATAGLTYVWTVGNLAAGEGGVITITGILSKPLKAGTFTNTASITTTAYDDTPENNSSPVRVTVSNVAPLAANDTYTTPEDMALTIAAPGVLDNDQDANGDPLVAVKDGGPVSGTLALNPDGSFAYTPTLNLNGVVTFSYHTTDTASNSNNATVTIIITPVNDPPLAAGDAYTTPEDTSLTVIAPGVLANDSDVDGDLLLAALDSGPVSGTLALNPDGSFTYTPTLNLNGVVTFSYHTTDTVSNSNSATVTIAITPVNDPPLVARDSYTTPEDTSLTVIAPGVLANDRDVEGDPFSAVPASSPTSGAAALKADGSFVYTPALNLNGVVTFTYYATDTTSSSSIATVVITVTPENDQPLAVDDAYVTLEDIPLHVPAPGVLTNDDDVDGDLLAAVKDGNPSTGTLTLNTDGSLSYTPIPNYRGVVSFTYHAYDGIADSNIVTVIITMVTDNNAPLAVDDVYSTSIGCPLHVPVPGVLANDVDLDHDPLIAIKDSDPVSGTLDLRPDGSFVYTPALNFSGTVTFAYHTTDTMSNSNVATVFLTVAIPGPPYQIYLPLAMRESP